MVEIVISKKIKEKKYEKLIRFISNISNEVCFSSFHNYHLSEDDGVELINEYKQKCKEKHHHMQKMYDSKQPVFMRILKKIKVKNEQEFQEYKEQIFLSEMSQCKHMEKMIDELIANDKMVDYKEEFSEIKEDYKGIEMHMFDAVINDSFIPLDFIIYNLSNKIIELFVNKKSFFGPFLTNKDNSIMLINPLFCKNDDAICAVDSRSGNLTIFLNENDYLTFKKLKIKHKKEVISDEKYEL